METTSSLEEGSRKIKSWLLYFFSDIFFWEKRSRWIREESRQKKTPDSVLQEKIYHIRLGHLETGHLNVTARRNIECNVEGLRKNPSVGQNKFSHIFCEFDKELGWLDPLTTSCPSICAKQRNERVKKKEEEGDEAKVKDFFLPVLDSPFSPPPQKSWWGSLVLLLPTKHSGVSNWDLLNTI